MPKFRKKPVVVEAFQMTKERRWDNSEWPEWLNRAWNNDSGDGPAIWIDPTDPDLERLICGTLEGPHEITWDDFLIEGVKGELYPCKPDIFEATYEPQMPDDLVDMEALELEWKVEEADRARRRDILVRLGKEETWPEIMVSVPKADPRMAASRFDALIDEAREATALEGKS